METVPTKAALNQARALRHGMELQAKLSAATVAVCGLGGLGSNIAIALARMGVGRLVLIDFDRVDITNLHRQQYKASQIGQFKAEALAQNLREIDPYLQLIPHVCRVTEDNLAALMGEADIICEAFDDPEAKALLVNEAFARFPEKYLVAASGMAGLEPGNQIRTRQITERFFLCGDETSEASQGHGLFASRVMLCAAHQAHTVLRILAGERGV